MTPNLEQSYDKFSLINDYKDIYYFSNKYISQEFLSERGWNNYEGLEKLCGKIYDTYSSKLKQVRQPNTIGIAVVIYGLLFEYKYMEKVQDLHNLFNDIHQFMTEQMNRIEITDKSSLEEFILQSQTKVFIEKLSTLIFYFEPNTFPKLIGNEGVMRSVYFMLPMWACSTSHYGGDELLNMFDFSEITDAEVENFEYYNKIKNLLSKPENKHFFTRFALIINNALFCKEKNGLDKKSLVIKFIQENYHFIQVYYDTDGKRPTNKHEQRIRNAYKRTDYILETLMNLVD